MAAKKPRSKKPKTTTSKPKKPKKPKKSTGGKKSSYLSNRWREYVSSNEPFV
jgi:hypothetical protein